MSGNVSNMGVKLQHILKAAYHHHFIRYCLVGGTTFVMDLGILIVLHGKAHVDLSLATSTAYWVSNFYSFILSRYWTFSIYEKQGMSRHIILYSLLLVFNYFFTVIFINEASHHIHYWIAKILSVAILVTWSYPLYKWVIFVQKKPEAVPANE